MARNSRIDMPEAEYHVMIGGDARADFKGARNQRDNPSRRGGSETS